MTKHFGRISLLLATVSWLGYCGSLAVGGLDPSPSLSDLLQDIVLFTLLLALISLVLSLIALVRGPQRVSSGIAFCLSLLYCLIFTGLFFAIFAWFL